MDHGTPTQQRGVRVCSAALFGGARYRLEVCEVLQVGETVTASDLIERLPSPPTKASVHAEIQRLVAAGVLVRLNRRPGDRHAYLRVGDTCLWQAARELADAARHASSPGAAGSDTGFLAALHKETAR